MTTDRGHSPGVIREAAVPLAEGDARFVLLGLEPIEPIEQWEAGELPETYPFKV